MSCATQQLTAGDVMQRHVVTVSPRDTLRQVLALMTENHVTGLPVMDENSRCVGVITSSDILNYEQEHADDYTDSGTIQYFDPETQKWESAPISAFGLAQFDDTTVGEVMTTELIWVDRSAPLKEIARQMIEKRIHRVLVMDKRRQLYGIISAYDLIRIVAEET